VIDRDLHLAKALLIEGNPLLRSVTTAQLKDAGIGQVVQRSRVKDARLLLERETFDIVLCNREFEDSDISGQDLLEELRREQLLAPSTVFLMVTSQATYNQVVEAAEAALDGFIVRPFTAATLVERLLEARQRKRTLGDIHRALDAGELETAFARALRRFQERQPYWLYCGRLSAEILLRLGRAGDAINLFERISQTKPVNWARLGIVRAQLAAGRQADARRALDALLDADSKNADALDLQGRLRVERSDFQGALESFRAAVELTPGCMLRAQHAGALAFYLGHRDEALALLNRARSMGTQSKLFDALSLYLLALLHFDRQDGDGLREAALQLKELGQRHAPSIRLERMGSAIDALMSVRLGSSDPAIERLRSLLSTATSDDFDIEAAQVALTLWVRLPVQAHRDAQIGQFAQTITERFCTSKPIAELFMAAAQGHDAVVSAVRHSQARLQALAEGAMEQALQGQPEAAIRQLLEDGQVLGNSRLLDMAATLARKHQVQLGVPQAEALANQAEELSRRHSPGVGHIAGLLRATRLPGSLTWRGTPAAPGPTSVLV
jgi:DNA-binding NarL/FixJ family response regulator